MEKKAHRWQPLAISSTPIPCQTARVNWGMVWLEYFMLMQAAFPHSYGKKCMHLAQNTSLTEAKSASGIASET